MCWHCLFVLILFSHWKEVSMTVTEKEKEATPLSPPLIPLQEEGVDSQHEPKSLPVRKARLTSLANPQDNRMATSPSRGSSRGGR
ncbi:MAG: hypothetical protein V1763_01660 [Parcubacteria group bacterium]